MRIQSSVATTPPGTTDGRITELHLWAVREGLRRAPAAAVVRGILPTARRMQACRFGAPSPGCERYIRNGPVIPTPGGVTEMRGPSRRERGKAYDQDLRDSPYSYLRDTASAGKPCRYVCGVGWPAAGRDTIFRSRAVGDCRRQPTMSPN